MGRNERGSDAAPAANGDAADATAGTSEASVAATKHKPHRRSERFRVTLLGDDGKTLKLLTGQAAREHLKGPRNGGMLWVDIARQTQADIDLLAQTFRFHPLALEDCLHFDQRPKLEEYTGANPYLFIVTHNFVSGPSTNDLLSTRSEESSFHIPRQLTAVGRNRRLALQVIEVHAFLGPGYLVTVHAEHSKVIDSVLERLQHDPQLMTRGMDFVYYLVADALCDSNFPVLEDLSDLLDEMEVAILEEPTQNDLRSIYSLRKTMVTMRRVLSPQRDVLGSLFRHGGTACVNDKTAPYFRDIYDHLTRIYESLEAGRDLIASCIDAYLSSVGQRTNEIMRKLTMLSAFMLPMTFLTGFFGMNFEFLPIRSHGWFAATLILMLVAIPIGMYVWFSRKGWFVSAQREAASAARSEE